MILNAFSQAARNLLADAKFRDIVFKGGETVKETIFKSATSIVIKVAQIIFHDAVDDQPVGDVVVVHRDISKTD